MRHGRPLAAISPQHMVKPFRDREDIEERLDERRDDWLDELEPSWPEAYPDIDAEVAA